MSDRVAEAMLWGSAGYLALGLLVLAWLLAGGLSRIDTAAASAPVQVKLLLTPGLVALWPLILWRAFGRRAPEDRS